MGTGVVLLRLPRRDLRILWRLGLRRKLSVTLLRILRLAEIVAVCHLAPLVRSVSRQRMPGLLNEDAKKSPRVYRSDMIDVSLFLIRYESPTSSAAPQCRNQILTTTRTRCRTVGKRRTPCEPRARCVPDRRVKGGTWRIPTDNLRCRLTCNEPVSEA